MAAIGTLARSEGMIVLATIHQPSIETLAQFTDILLLSGGKLCFSGKVDDLETFFEKWGRPVPRFVRPLIHWARFFFLADHHYHTAYARGSCDELPQQ